MMLFWRNVLACDIFCLSSSSIVKWGYRENFKSAYFFYEKISRSQKHTQANINQQNKIKQTLNNKGNNFWLAQKNI